MTTTGVASSKYLADDVTAAGDAGTAERRSTDDEQAGFESQWTSSVSAATPSHDCNLYSYILHKMITEFNPDK